MTAQDPFIQAYTDRLSVPQGGEIGFCVSTDLHFYGVEIARIGARRQVVWTRWGLPGREHPVPADASERGCGWPVSFTVPGRRGLAFGVLLRPAAGRGRGRLRGGRGGGLRRALRPSRARRRHPAAAADQHGSRLQLLWRLHLLQRPAGAGAQALLRAAVRRVSREGAVPVHGERGVRRGPRPGSRPGSPGRLAGRRRGSGFPLGQRARRAPRRALAHPRRRLPVDAGEPGGRARRARRLLDLAELLASLGAAFRRLGGGRGVRHRLRRQRRPREHTGAAGRVPAGALSRPRRVLVGADAGQPGGVRRRRRQRRLLQRQRQLVAGAQRGAGARPGLLEG